MQKTPSRASAGAFFVPFFALGLLAVLWIGAGFIGHNLLALVMTVLIGVVYVLGTLELRQFRQATTGLAAALENLPASVADLGSWLAGLPAGLQNPVRLRLEGERVALPAPALTPYLVGLLVMLGMLGTFLGMVSTFNGAAFALEGSAELQAIRSALTLPIKGLGLAFGTSVAGVATSAILGLLSALCRRERQQVVQQLESRLAHELRPFSLAQQRQDAYQAIQSQANALPAVVEQLQALIAGVERQQQTLNEQLLRNQQSFHAEVQRAYSELAGNVDRTLRNSLTDGVRAAGESIRPVAEAALQGIAAAASQQQEQLRQTVAAQLDSLSERVTSSAERMADAWRTAAEQQDAGTQRLLAGFENTLASIGNTVSSGNEQLLARLDTAHSEQQRNAATADAERLAGWTAALQASASQLQAQWQAAGQEQQAQQQRLLERLDATASALAAGQQSGAERFTAFSRELEQRSLALLEQLAEAQQRQQTAQSADEQQRLAAWTAALDAAARRLQAQWQSASDEAVHRQQQLAAALDAASAAIASRTQDGAEQLAAFSRDFDQRAAALLAQLADGQRQQQAAHGEAERERLAAWTQSLSQLAADLRGEWQSAGAATLARQQDICATLEATASTITEQTQRSSEQTLAEISRLLNTAAEAPRAAAEVIAELRQELSASVARDNTLLEERGRILGTLNTLLETINQASAQQRQTIDALVASAEALLNRASGEFATQVATEGGRLTELSAQIVGGAVEVSALGESFNVAVQQFSTANDKLIDQLNRIETALGQSLARSDEQLAYYVAQAREIIDLSLMSNKEVVEEMRQLAGNNSKATEAA